MFINGIDIIIEDKSQRLKKKFFSNFKKKNKDDNLKLSFNNNNTFVAIITILFHKIISTINLDHPIK